MPDAVIVSYARTGLAKSVRGGFNATHGAAMGGHAVKHAMARAKIDPAEVEDVVVGCGNPEGATGHNTGRDIAAVGRLPGHHQRHDHQPLLLLRPELDRGGRQLRAERRRQGRGRRRAWRASASSRWAGT